MSDTTISCPKCGAEVPLTEALNRRLRAEAEAEFEKQRAELNAALAAREKKLEAERAALEQRTAAVEAELTRRLEAERAKLATEAARQAEEKLSTEMRDLQARLAEQQAKLKAAQDSELKLRRRQRELEEQKQALELEVARKLDAERQKIAADAAQRAVEAERLKLADKDNIIKQLQEQIAALKQRAEQGSMQLQGETLELTLEADLRAAFPADEIAEVKKGQRGADVIQHVRTSAGGVCGAILWEAKRAKNWSADWLEKLKEDQRAARADLAVLVTTCPPESVRGIAQQDGIWVCEPPFAVALSAALRHGLICVAAQRVQQADRADKAQLLYQHICSLEFRQHIEALVDTFVKLREQLDAEKRAFARQWKEREQQIEKAVTHTAMLYGGVQGIAGREALPELKALSLPGGE